jgi:hypothetical protein
MCVPCLIFITYSQILSRAGLPTIPGVDMDGRPMVSNIPVSDDTSEVPAREALESQLSSSNMQCIAFEIYIYICIHTRQVYVVVTA